MLWSYRFLFANLFVREIRNRYVGSASGLLWALAHPLLLLGVFAFVFSVVFRPPELAGKHYLLFVAVALWPWLAFQEGLQRGTVVIQSYAGLVKKVAFPHELLIYASVAATFALHLTGYLLVLTALATMGEPVAYSGIVLALAVWLTLFLGTIGLTLFLAGVQVFFKDVEHILNPVLQVFMYLAPILYPLSLVPPGLRGWVAGNPMSYLIERLRDALELGQLLPQVADLTAVAAAITVFALGRTFFLRLSPYFEDFV
jgi:ABC-type polysaccharide/polyol phosphate export permease